MKRWLSSLNGSNWLWPAGLFVLALLARAGSLFGQGFDGLYGQDPFAYFTYAVGPLRTALLHLQPLPPFFWPPGYPLLITFGSLLFGVTPLVGEWLSLIAGSLLPVLTFLLANEVCIDLQGALSCVPLLAGLVTVFHPQLWQSSIVVMSDTVSLAAATLGGWALARYARLDRPRWLALSAVALAYAIATRWAYALMAIPCAAYGVYLLFARSRAHRADAVRGAVAATLSGGAVLAALLGPGLLTRSGTAGPAFTGDLAVYSWSPLNFLRRQFVTADGLLSYRLPNGLYYGLSPAHPDYFTPLLVALLLPGLWLLLRQRRAMPWVLLLAWPAMVLGFHAGAPWQNFRFTLAALPPLAVLLALGAAQVAAWLNPRWRWLLGALIVAGLAWQAWDGLQLSRQFIVRKGGDLALVTAVEAQAPANAQLLAFNITATFDYYSRLETHDLWSLDAGQVARIVADGHPTLLLIDVANVEAQWQGRAPSNNYHWLRDGPGLDPLGQYQNYTLYQVR
jgi:4-amino-4-deoxy-L-arabinose transferase-like glycosyltransferase